MGIFSFIIGFVIGWGFLSSYVSKFVTNLPVDVGGVCLFKLGQWCLFGFGLVGLLTGLVTGLVFYLIFKK